jgi:hypothetical protein
LYSRFFVSLSSIPVLAPAHLDAAAASRVAAVPPLPPLSRLVPMQPLASAPAPTHCSHAHAQRAQRQQRWNDRRSLLSVGRWPLAMLAGALFVLLACSFPVRPLSVSGALLDGDKYTSRSWAYLQKFCFDQSGANNSDDTQTDRRMARDGTNERRTVASAATAPQRIDSCVGAAALG